MEDVLTEIVRFMAAKARETWEPIWPLWKLENNYPGPLEPASLDACIPTAFALCVALNVTAEEFRWQVNGGRPTKRTPFGGFLDSAGRPHAHLWVEGRRRGQFIVVDITADQFGATPVIVAVGGSREHTPNLSRNLRSYYERMESKTIGRLHAALDAAMNRPQLVA